MPHRRPEPPWAGWAVIVLVPVAVVAAMGTSTQAQPQPIASATLSQRGTDLVLRLRTKAPDPLSDGVLLCARRVSARRRPVADVCVRGRRGSRPLLQLRRLDASGATVAKLRLHGSIRLSKASVSATFGAADAGIRLGTLRWQAVSAQAGQRCTESAQCPGTLPASGYFTFKVRRAVGCVPSGSSFRRSGSRSGRRVALTFDDGPSPYTPAILHTLERLNVHATFFVVGIHIGGRSRVLRRALSDGDAIGNHSFAHHARPGSGDLDQTSAAIRRATGYVPCLFRAPYGDLGGGVVGSARKLGMLTIGWNDDPSDWATPGPGTIAARVLNQVRPGSIVVMHDGGGPRGQTAAALEAIVIALRRRGDDPVSVPELLGLATRYR